MKIFSISLPMLSPAMPSQHLDPILFTLLPCTLPKQTCIAIFSEKHRTDQKGSVSLYKKLHETLKVLKLYYSNYHTTRLSLTHFTCA